MFDLVDFPMSDKHVTENKIVSVLSTSHLDY